MTTWAGNLIKLTRMKTGLSQRDLAERAGTSQPAIAAYEAGRKDPSVSTLAKIVRAAGLDLRIGLAPHDDHDEWLRLYEERLAPDVRRRVRRELEEMRGLARREREAASA